MVKYDMLEKAIDESGLKKVYLAGKLGITKQCFSNKIAGKTEFVGSEISALSKELRLTPKQTKDIFLSSSPQNVNTEVAR